MSEKIAIIGGDNRLLYTARYLMKKNYHVRFFADGEIEGFSDIPSYSLDGCLDNTDYVILPLPVTKNGREIFSTLSPAVEIGELFRKIPKNAGVFVGKADLSVKIAARDNGISVTDYYENESFLIQNAVLTAEGAIAIITEAVPVSVADLSVTVFGYGRCAAQLTRRLILLGADVSVVARAQYRLALAKADGATPFHPEEAPYALSRCDVAVNTVPAPVIGYNEARVLNNKPIIEIADKSGVAEGVRANIIRAAGLPGRFSPQSAGELIAKSVLEKI